MSSQATPAAGKPQNTAQNASCCSRHFGTAVKGVFTLAAITAIALGLIALGASNTNWAISKNAIVAYSMTGGGVVVGIIIAIYTWRNRTPIAPANQPSKGKETADNSATALQAEQQKSAVLQSEKANLQSKLTAAQSIAFEHEKALSAKKTELENLQQASANIASRIQQLESQNASLTTERNQYAQQVASLQKQNTELLATAQKQQQTAASASTATAVSSQPAKQPTSAALQPNPNSVNNPSGGSSAVGGGAGAAEGGGITRLTTAVKKLKPGADDYS